MNILLLIALITNTQKSVEIRFTQTPPRIDGVIEEAWQQADSAYDFVQFAPYEKTGPSEKTTVYLLQDDNNLYVAFRCYAESIKPIACLTKDEDYVVFGIDPFMSKTTGYYFWVYGSEIMWDGWVLDDGRNYDDSWEGVWYKGIKLYDNRMEVEFKIPFKSIRYKKDINEWGIQFQRYIASKRETSYWTEVSQIDRDMVSRWGTLTKINPKSAGYYFELYPEGYTRLDRNYYYNNTTYALDSTKAKIKPSASINFKWDITPQTTLNATAYPDFAQIEADPYTLNLGRYPTYLNERRPFFVEGREIFRMSNLGSAYFQPMEIFYSRRIGKSAGDVSVPIIGGLKLTSRSKEWGFGFLGAYTDKYSNSIAEGRKGYGVLKLNRKILETSDIGLLAVSSYANDSNYNYAVGFDGIFRQGPNSLILQSAFSDRNRKQGLALTTGYRVVIKDFITVLTAQMIQDSFDVSEIGFVPWVGRKSLFLVSGPFKTYRQGKIRHFNLYPSVGISQETSNDKWSKSAGFEGDVELRNFWGLNLGANLGRQYESDTNFLSRSMNANIHGRVFNSDLNFGCAYWYGINYPRSSYIPYSSPPYYQFAPFMAYQGTNWFSYSYAITPTIRPEFWANWTIEWDTFNKVISTTPVFRPKIYFRFKAPIELTVFSELVMNTSSTAERKTDLVRVRNGLLFAWNFSPKSWFYFVVNDSRSDDAQGKLLPRYQGGAIKIKYLFYF